jgi:pseudouridine-5'-phosphate glycosidase/pseudouridine kinase
LTESFLGILIAFYLTPEEARQSKWNATKTNIANHQIVINSSRGHIVVLKHFSALKASDIVNVTGAGDSLVGTLLASLVSNPSYNVFHDPTLLDIAIQKAQEAAVLTLQSPLAVSPLLSTLSS